MGLMILGSLTFSRNPQEMTNLDPQRFNAYLMTYSSVAFFSWGSDIVGKEIELKWPMMPANEFASLRTIYEADNTVVFNPNDGLGSTYNVELINLNSKYFAGRAEDASTYRQDVVLTLLILAQN